MRRRNARWLLILMPLLVGGAMSVAAERAADDLLRIAPKDASLTISVENLKDHRQAFLGSRLGEALQTLPSYQRWRASAGFARFLKARKEIEQALGTDLKSAADDLLGDAVVLVLRVEPGGPVDEPRGLLLLKFHNEATVKRLIASLNDGERQAGSLVGLDPRKRGSQAYTVRRFANGAKPDEAYAILPGQVFVWANSEALVTGVLDRVGQDTGLLSNPDFQSVRNGLPAQAVASLYVSSNFLQLIPTEAPEDVDAGQRLILKAIRQYLDSIRYAGVSLRFDDDLRLDTLECRDVDRLGPIGRRKAENRAGLGVDELLGRLPADSIVVGAGRIDLEAIKQAVFLWLNDADRQKVQHLLQTLSGLTLGRSLTDEILPSLGPGAVGVLSAPRSDGAHPGQPVFLLGLEFQGGEPMGLAIENGIRSAFTLMALDSNRGGVNLVVDSLTINGQPLVTLTRPSSMLAEGIRPPVLAVGNQAEAVSEFLTDPEPASNGQEPMAVRDRQARFSDADAFLHIDLEAALRRETGLQAWLVRSVSKGRGGDETSALRDLEQVLGLMRLFRAGYLTRTVTDDLSMVRHSLVLVPRDDLREAR